VATQRGAFQIRDLHYVSKEREAPVSIAVDWVGGLVEKRYKVGPAQKALSGAPEGSETKVMPQEEYEKGQI